MNDPREATDAIRDLLRGIPDLVAELGGDEKDIKSYDPEVPAYRTVDEAIAAMEDGEALVVYMGFELGELETVKLWMHHWSVIFRAPGDVGIPGRDPHPGYIRLGQLALSGVPTNGDGQAFQFTDFHPSYYPPHTFNYTRTKDTNGQEIWNLGMSAFEIDP